MQAKLNSMYGTAMQAEQFCGSESTYSKLKPGPPKANKIATKTKIFYKKLVFSKIKHVMKFK